MEDIIINGVSLNTLKEQKKAIREGASQVIAENIAKALTDFNKLKQATTKEEAHSIATRIVEALETAEIVSGVSGVRFLLPYYEEYGNYDSDEIISMFLENSEEEDVFGWEWNEEGNPLQKLYSLAESMECDSRDWHSSRC